MSKNGTRDDWFRQKYREMPNGCWEWVAARDPNGYGRFGNGGRTSAILAHRYSYLMHYGEFDRRRHVLHSCDNPPCVNPEHLSLGDAYDNAHDAIAKGRHVPPPHPRGTAHPRARLTDEQVIEMREIYARGGVSQRQLSLMFLLSQPCVGRVLRGETYMDVGK